MRNFILGFILALALAGAGYWVVTTRPFGLGEISKSQTAVKYHCPMHPTYISDKPGNCPICGMKLVPIETWNEAPAARAQSSGQKKILYWVDPMNPAHRSDKPGKAPDGMDLVPVYEETGGPGSASSV